MNEPKTGLTEIRVETPAGSIIKYNLDADGRLRVKKKLPDGLPFPYPFGLIPGTLGEDGDELDVFVICEFNLVAGALLDARLIGSIRVMQEKSGRMVRNDRYLAVPAVSTDFSHVDSIEQLPEQIVASLRAFIEAYIGAGGNKIVIEDTWNAAAANKEAAAGKATAS